MESTTILSQETQYEHYRTISFAAIVALVFGIISLPTILVVSQTMGILVFPLMGMLIGVYSVLKLRRRSDEFTGQNAARIGLFLSTLVFFSGLAWGSYCYATEVPDGYTRVKFSELQPDPKLPQQPLPPVVQDLAGKKVFIKGYVYPDGQSVDIKQFVLVPDMGTCCFGGKPKLTDMVQVTLDDPLRIEYSYYRRNLAGTFRLGSTSAEKVGQIIYQLDADYVK